MNVNDKRSKETAELLIRESLPGTVHARMIAGPLDDPRTGAYVAAVSRLEDSWYTTLLRLYPEPSEKNPYGQGTTRDRPHQFPGVPLPPEGISIRYQRVHDDPIEAGADYGFMKSTLLQEAVEPEERLTGMSRLEHWIHKREQKELFGRLYSDPELAQDPHYRAELERQIEALVPDPEEREALHSLYAFRYSGEE